MLLYLVRELVFHILLDSAQHERLEDHVQPGQLVWNTNIKPSMFSFRMYHMGLWAEIKAQTLANRWRNFSVRMSWRSYVSWAGKDGGKNKLEQSAERNIIPPTVVEFYSLSSMADLFSAWLSMSLENHSLNSSWESNSVGMMKCSRAHSWETVITYGRQQFCLDLMNTHALA